MTATYIDENGKKTKGVTADKSVYAGVETENAAAAAAPENTPAATGGYIDDMRSFYTNAYNEQVTANNAAAQKAAEEARKQVDESIAELGTQYGNTNKQLYRQYMKAERALPEQMAAQGYTGGLTESSRLKLATGYGESLAENERARLGQEAQLEKTAAQARYEAQAAATEANNAARQQQLSYLAALEEAEYQQRAQAAQTMAAAGDFSGYLTLGYSQDEVDYLTRVWLKENPAYAELWAAQHPEDAERLGLTKKRSYNGGGTNNGIRQEVIDASDIYSRAVLTGNTVEEVAEVLKADVANGKLTADEAQRVMGNVTKNALQQEKNSYAAASAANREAINAADKTSVADRYFYTAVPFDGYYNPMTYLVANALSK